jgi:hypothetical protein
MSGWDIFGDGRCPTRPWGDRPPPAPATASAADWRRVERAWRSWSHFRPSYRRLDDGRVEADINLKDNIWLGRGRGATPEEAAWNALQDCIVNWQGYIAALYGSPARRCWWRLGRRWRRRRWDRG